MISIYLSLLDEGQKKKFEMIYYNFKDLMYYIAYEVVRNERDAEDAVQEAFVRILKNISKIEDIEGKETKNFVAVITKREAMKIYNKKRNRSESAGTEVEYIRIADSAPVNMVKMAIEKLPYKYSSLLTLKYVMGYSGKEISKIIGLSETNVRQQLLKARKMLSKMLEEE